MVSNKTCSKYSILIIEVIALVFIAGGAQAHSNSGEEIGLYSNDSNFNNSGESFLTNAEGWMDVGITGPYRGGMGYAYDSNRKRGVIFGGSNLGESIIYSEIWEYDGEQWKNNPIIGPSARSSLQMAYDSARGEVVLYGGWTRPDNYLGDTWAYNGTNWTRMSTSGPGERANVAMAYDKERRKVILFGGSRYQSIYGDTWEWDGTSWSRVSTAGPVPRIFSRMFYDEAQKKTVLFGGQSHYFGTLLNDTWEWDGVSWKQIAVVGPEPRSEHMMAYDPDRQKIVLYGGGRWGDSKPIFEDTWEWDGYEWTKINVNGTGARKHGAIFYDEVKNNIILYGGYGGYDGNVIYNDTWAYLPSDAPLVSVSPLLMNASLNQNFTINITIAPSITPVFSAEFVLKFDPEKLEALNISQGDFLSQDGASTMILVKKIDNTLGEITYNETRVGVQTGITMEGALSSVEFRVVSNVNYGISYLNFTKTQLSDSQTALISNVNIRNGSVSIIDNQPPFVDCEPDKLKCENADSPVQFNASASYDPDGYIISYLWDFGDNTNGTDVAPKHTYAAHKWNGSAYQAFIVNLTVTDNDGLTNMTSQSVIIWIAGDANGDGVVSILDASVVGLKWNTSDLCADLNNDGKVNIIDASIIGFNWGKKA